MCHSQFLLSLLVLLNLCYGDYLKVSRTATIKSTPSSQAMIIERVERGIYLELMNDGKQERGYYRVRSTIFGQPGYIYRTFVRRYPGEIPEQVSTTEFDDPLGDPTYYLTEQDIYYAKKHLAVGKPQAVYERVREGYVVGQDGRLKIPLWFQYVLSPEDLSGEAGRSDKFYPDTSIPFGYRAQLTDYEGSGYDRGHLAPADHMKRSKKVMDESFLLSNMAPQVGAGFNQQIWKYLEMATKGWVEARGALTIITGPIFEVENNKVQYEVIGSNHVAVPTHFYKIVVDAKDLNNVAALAFILPNKRLSGHEFSEYLKSVDEIEQKTGLDFLSRIPVDVQEEVEAESAGEIW